MPGLERSFLSPLSVSTLPAEPEVLRRLTLLGVVTLGAFAALPRLAVIRQFGPQTFNFPAGYTLAPGATVRIESYTGAVNNPPAVLLWSTGAIWANAGDKAVLYNDVGTAIDSACYGNGCP